MISQTIFATKAEISQARLAKYELGFVPLPWEIGERFCRVFRINPRWLGTGRGGQWDEWNLVDPQLVEGLGRRPLFSEVIDEIVVPFSEHTKLSKRMDDWVEKLNNDIAEKFAAREHPSGVDSRPGGPFLSISQANAWHNFTWQIARPLFAKVPNDKIDEFTRELTSAGQSILTRYPDRKRPRVK